MSSFSAFLKSFPVTLAALSAAIAAVSGIVMPAALIPDNQSSLGAEGSLLILIAFLFVWAFQTTLRRWRRLVFAVVTLACVAALWTMVRVNRIAVEEVDAIGNPPRSARFIVGTEFTSNGREWHRMLGEPSRAVFIQRIGPDKIRDAWGSSYEAQDLRYTAAYLILAGGLVLMLGVTEFAQRKRT